MHNSRILITGGAGFIGSNAARLFHSLQNEILIVDRSFPVANGVSEPFGSDQP